MDDVVPRRARADQRQIPRINTCRVKVYLGTLCFILGLMCIRSVIPFAILLRVLLLLSRPSRSLWGHGINSFPSSNKHASHPTLLIVKLACSCCILLLRILSKGSKIISAPYSSSSHRRWRTQIALKFVLRLFGRFSFHYHAFHVLIDLIVLWV